MHSPFDVPFTNTRTGRTMPSSLLVLTNDDPFSNNQDLTKRLNRRDKCQSKKPWKNKIFIIKLMFIEQRRIFKK